MSLDASICEDCPFTLSWIHLDLHFPTVDTEGDLWLGQHGQLPQEVAHPHLLQIILKITGGIQVISSWYKLQGKITDVTLMFYVSEISLNISMVTRLS